MKNNKSIIILFGMIAGAVLGIAGGYYFGEYIIHLKFLGTIFLNALKMVVIPLIVSSMIIGITSLGDIAKLGRTAGKTLLYFLSTTGIAVLIGFILVSIIRPGVGVPMLNAGIPAEVAQNSSKTVSDIIIGLIPDNIFRAVAEGNVLGLIVFSLLFGGVLTVIGKKGRTVIAFFEGVNEAIMKLVMIIIYFAPVGVFALLGGIVAENQSTVSDLVSGLGWYSLTIIAGLLIHGGIVLPLILKIMGKKNPLQYFLNMGQALATAFTTASSSATLPVTIEGVQEKNKIDSKAASFVLPLGATINMDGTALYEAVAALFIAQVYGIDLSLGAQVIIFITATLVSIGAAGIPHAGTVMMVFVLSAVGLPLEGIGLIWAIDWFLDRCRTTVNVWGDAVGAAVIAETKEMKSLTADRPDFGKFVRSKPMVHSGEFTSAMKPSSSSSTGRPSPRTPRRNDSHPRERKSDYTRNSPGDRSDRGDRGERSERSERGDRRYKERGRPSGTRVERPRPEKETEPREKVKIDQELEKVRKQLKDLGQRPKEAGEEVPETAAQKADEFFNVEFSKMKFFDEDKENRPTAEKTDSTIDTDSTDRSDEHKSPLLVSVPEETVVENIPVEENIASDSEEKPQAIEKSESSDEDSWGRARKKRPSK